MAEVESVDPFFRVPTFRGSNLGRLRRWNPAVVLAMLLVAWLHLVGHLPFRFCDVVLTVIGYILAEAGQATLVPRFPSSLSGTLSSLNLDPMLQSLPTCPECLEPHPESVYADPHSRCIKCGTLLFTVEPDFEMDAARGRRSSRQRKWTPRLKTPYKSITEQLGDVLSLPGNDDAMDWWRRVQRVVGKLRDFFDGGVSRELLGPDRKPFFHHDLAEGPDGELRIGLALGVDWFSYLRSLIAPSYTSCPMSFNIINFPPYLRFRATNLLLTCIIPGPKESDPDQTQRFLRVLVNELLRLWKHGAIIPTHRHPRGRLVRVILVGVFCDKPAAHKIGGFGSHSHTFFCTRDWITQGLKATLEAFVANAFPARTNEDHRARMREYQACPSKNARDEFVKAHGVRWSELARLPYFDMCRMIVVDPMHNLFLGLVKNHFYHIWVQLRLFRKSKELKRLHEVLSELDLPSKLGRLPKLIGEPAGGSLTADQWLILATVVGPLALPELWEGLDAASFSPQFFQERREFLKVAAQKRKERPAAQGAPNKANRTRSSTRPRTRRKRGGTQRGPNASTSNASDDEGAIEIDSDEAWTDDESEGEAEDVRHPSRLHPRDLENFLKLSSALTILLAHELDEQQLAQADRLLREYCIELIELYGPDVIRPNHHYATHTPEFVRDYGPLREFWTFIFERLNRLLKSYKTSNHGGGEIETTFFREYHRTIQLYRLMAEGLSAPQNSTLYQTCHAMHAATADNRGTLQQLARELDEARRDEQIALELSPRFSREHMPDDLYTLFLSQLQMRLPLQHFHADLTVSNDPTSMAVPNIACFFDYAVVSGHRYHARLRTTCAANTLAAIRVSDTQPLWVAEILNIVSYNSPPVPQQHFAHVRWLRPLAASFTFDDTPWASL
ncbi:hypothetical protein OH76DRAFT_1361580 [Lentinus brumalis]|uniref:Uncharacterized protein n=1 Tax=Lentinus brumalis TaxID=2498619 RepID=A0A371CS60_9APHY|nr:hypothetical protein OH76DRAFT_1361580 [Polyporus brumalis]